MAPLCFKTVPTVYGIILFYFYIGSQKGIFRTNLILG